ncbi:GNAT family N-acetyltransferase [Serratia odorifera]|uniref:GNAT family N-acetyltransferase n=1 Tax=Serratia odorifera TaxID=618 RepID=UPI0018E74E88|nr:GNAT family N-acetyltransferase [Serratia odorifera]MBJ2065758.1 GNAT family N-acetyltransferase [Serratia odorifera]
MSQQIVFLSDYPQYADVCAAWAFGQWGSQRGGSLEGARQRYALCSQSSTDHFTLMMIDEQRPLAMASLWPSDDHHRRDLTPWLAGVFVHPDHRRQGIARRLEQAVLELAQRGGHPLLHLLTDKCEALYAAWGWRTIERRQQYGDQVVVMERRL